MNTTFENWARAHQVSLHLLFPSLHFKGVASPNMGLGSNFFEGDPQHENLKLASNRLAAFQQQHSNTLLANGYLEQRAFYNTRSYERETPTGIEFRNIHLGTDFWVPDNTPVHSPFNAQVVISHDNNIRKDYGPLIVLQHEIEAFTFYSLYGHLSKASLELSPVGKNIRAGDRIGYIGNERENGRWVPHLHFQLITDLLGETENYNGVCYPSELEVWRKRCPDPDLIFIESLS